MHALVGVPEPGDLWCEFQIHSQTIDKPMDHLGRATAQFQSNVLITLVAVLPEDVSGHDFGRVLNTRGTLQAGPRRGYEAAGDDRGTWVAGIFFQQHDIDSSFNGCGRARRHETGAATADNNNIRFDIPGHVWARQDTSAAAPSPPRRPSVVAVIRPAPEV